MYPDRTGPFFWGVLFSFFFVMTKSSCTILCQQSFLRWKATNVSVENWQLSLPSLWCALPPSLGPRSTELTLEASLRSLVTKNPSDLSVPGGHEESRDGGGAESSLPPGWGDGAPDLSAWQWPRAVSDPPETGGKLLRH